MYIIIYSILIVLITYLLETLVIIISLEEDLKTTLLFLTVIIMSLNLIMGARNFEKYPPKYIYVYSDRQQCSMNGDFENLKAKTQAYIWVIWEKDYKGETIIRWI